MTKVKSWLSYGAAGAALTVVAAGIAGMLVGGDARAVWIAAVIAYVLQLGAFGLMVWLQGQPQLFMIGWLAGMMVRFGAVGVCAFWLSRTAVLPLSTTLLSLVGFLFLLLLLEPLFLRHGRYDQRV
jgi:hypothetical protein